MSLKDSEKLALEEIMLKVLRQGGMANGLSSPFTDFLQALPKADRFVSASDSNFGKFGARHVALPGGKVLTVGGHISVGNGLGATSVEMYDPSLGVNGEWVVKASLPAPRFEGDALLLKHGPHAGKVLWIGGNHQPFVGDPYFRFLDPATIFGDCYLYDVDADTWTATGSLPGGDGVLISLPVKGAVELPDGKVVMAGHVHKLDGFGLGPPFPPGSGPAASKKTYIWDPAAGTWSAGADMHTARQGHSLAALKDGRVLAVGGTAVDALPTSTFYATAEVYDPINDAWTQYTMPAITDADGTNEKASRDGDPVVKTVTGATRAWASIAVLPDGRALIYGGHGLATEAAAFRSRRGCLYFVPGVLLSTGPNVYTPDQFTPAPSMVIAKTGFRATGILPDGRIVAVGGQDDKTGFFDGSMAHDVQYFDPVKEQWILSPASIPGIGAGIPFAGQGAVTTDGKFVSTGGYTESFANNVKSIVLEAGDKNS